MNRNEIRIYKDILEAFRQSGEDRIKGKTKALTGEQRVSRTGENPSRNKASLAWRAKKLRLSAADIVVVMDNDGIVQAIMEFGEKIHQAVGARHFDQKDLMGVLNGLHSRLKNDKHDNWLRLAREMYRDEILQAGKRTFTKPKRK